MSDELEKIKRHLGRPVPISITNLDGETDIFYLKPLNIRQQALLMEISKEMKQKGTTSVEIEENGKKRIEEIPNISKEDLTEMLEVLVDVFTSAYPGVDKETAEEFCNTNFDQLSEALGILMPKVKSNKELESLNKAREAIKNG